MGFIRNIYKDAEKALENLGCFDKDEIELILDVASKDAINDMEKIVKGYDLRFIKTEYLPEPIDQKKVLLSELFGKYKMGDPLGSGNFFKNLHNARIVLLEYLESQDK